MKTLHFGIEMEMTGITREKAANLMAGFFGTGRGTYEGGAYDTYTALDNQGRTWKAMNDSSIRPQRKVGGQIEGATRDYRTEVVSPILSYDDIPKLQELVRTLRKARALGPLYDAIAMAGTGIIFWFGAKNVQGTGWEMWNIASFTTFLACFTKLAVKTSHAAKLFNAVQKAQVSWQRIKPLLQQAAPEGMDQPLGPVEPVDLEVRDLACHYPGQEKGLEGISFTARPGDIIGITGPVACGKSLLGKVFLDEVPWTGSIRCKGRDFAALDRHQRRSLISYLGHDPELLSTSIGENIRMGDPVDVDRFLSMTNLREEVAAMPQGADTPVGSGGTQLSGGQQARIALARTLAHARSVLVLDDPFAAVDRKGETKILEAMRKAFPDRVILLISHRLTHFPEFTGVLFLENGRGQFGTHEQLLQEEPGYARLVQLQQEGVDLDEQ